MKHRASFINEYNDLVSELCVIQEKVNKKHSELLLRIRSKFKNQNFYMYKEEEIQIQDDHITEAQLKCLKELGFRCCHLSGANKTYKL